MSAVLAPDRFPIRQPRPKPKGVKKARLKHRRRAKDTALESDILENGSDLYNRFFSLPSELRNQVYRLLLVQPCKFDMYHNEGCTRLVCDNFPGPRFENQSQVDLLRLYRCADCSCTSSWRTSTLPVFVSPARSRWGDDWPNEFMCDICWYRKFGNIERPSMDTLQCLCTRRQNLDILLVNKRFNREASYVFWTENHFAFENSCLLTGFLNNISLEARMRITRISLMAHGSFDDSHDEENKLPPPRHLTPLWEMLRDCNGLVQLELDSHYLTHVRYVLGMRMLRASRSVTFCRHPHAQEVGMEHRGAPLPGTPQLIWPALAFRQSIADSPGEWPATRELASVLAASIVKGRPCGPKYLKILCKKSLASGSR